MLADEEKQFDDFATDSIDVGKNEAEAASIKRARDGRPLNGDEFMSRLRTSTSSARSQPFPTATLGTRSSQGTFGSRYQPPTTSTKP